MSGLIESNDKDENTNCNNWRNVNDFTRTCWLVGLPFAGFYSEVCTCKMNAQSLAEIIFIGNKAWLIDQLVATVTWLCRRKGFRTFFQIQCS